VKPADGTPFWLPGAPLDPVRDKLDASDEPDASDIDDERTCGDTEAPAGDTEDLRGALLEAAAPLTRALAAGFEISFALTPRSCVLAVGETVLTGSPKSERWLCMRAATRLAAALADRASDPAFALDDSVLSGFGREAGGSGFCSTTVGMFVSAEGAAMAPEGGVMGGEGGPIEAKTLPDADEIEGCR
jgi:hypothetical protein